MGQYRDDLDAARQRIAALESELAAKRMEKESIDGNAMPPAPEARRRRRVAREPHHATAPVVTNPEVDEFMAYAAGTAIPPRLRWISRLTTLAFLAVHAAIAWVVVVPHLDGPIVFWVVGFLIPLPLAMAAGRFVRALVDPSVGHYDRGNPENHRAPSVVRYSRSVAAMACGVIVLVEAAWVGVALPAMQHAGRRPCPQCQTKPSTSP